MIFVAGFTLFVNGEFKRRCIIKSEVTSKLNMKIYTNVLYEFKMIILEDPNNFTAGLTYCYNEKSKDLHEEVKGRIVDTNKTDDRTEAGLRYVLLIPIR